MIMHLKAFDALFNDVPLFSRSFFKPTDDDISGDNKADMKNLNERARHWSIF
jgi:hypothetical protein